MISGVLGAGREAGESSCPPVELLAVGAGGEAKDVSEVGVEVGVVGIAEISGDLRNCQRGVFAQPLSGFLEAISADDGQRWQADVAPREALHAADGDTQAGGDLIDADDRAV